MFGENPHEAPACCCICTWPLSKGVKEANAAGPSHTGICCVSAGHWEGDTYSLHLLFVWGRTKGDTNAGSAPWTRPDFQISSCWQERRDEKCSSSLLGLAAPRAAGPQLEAGGEDGRAVQPSSHIPLVTHDITAKTQAPVPAAALANPESLQLPPPVYPVLWKEQTR